MRHRSLAFLTLSFLLLLAACGGGSASTSTASTSGAPAGGEQTVTIPIGDFYVHSPQTTFLTGVHYHLVVTNEGKHHHDFLIMHPITTETMTMDNVYTHALSYIYNAVGTAQALHRLPLLPRRLQHPRPYNPIRSI